MLLYAVGATDNDIRDLVDFCLEHGHTFRAMKNIGRPRISLDTKKLEAVYRKTNNVRETAEALNITPSTARRYLKNIGAIDVQWSDNGMRDTTEPSVELPSNRPRAL